MKKLILTALALLFVTLAGCAHMPGGVMGTGAAYDQNAWKYYPDGPRFQTDD
jgi:hypothetical protein